MTMQCKPWLPCAAAVIFVAATALPLERALAASESCELTEKVMVHKRAKPKSRKKPAKAGATLQLGKAWGKWTAVRVGKTKGFIRTAELAKVCKASEASSEETAAADEEELPIEGIPPKVDAPAGTDVAAVDGAAAELGAEPPDAEAEAPADGETPAEAGAPAPIETAAVETPSLFAGMGDDDDAGGRTTVVVMDLERADEFPSEIHSTVIGAVTESLEKTRAFKALAMQDVKDMLSMEAFKQQAGCDSASCMAEIAGALGADYMISGSIVQSGAEGESFVLELRLIDSAAARTAGRVSRQYTGDLPGLVKDTHTAALILVRDVLAQSSGTLALSCNEEGATVAVDDVIVGVTPLQPMSSPSGVHTVTITKEGFVVATRDVSIKPNGTSEVSLNLRPSQEFVRRYTESAESVRTWAWVGTIGGGLCAVLAAGAYLLADARASTVASRVREFNASPEPDPDTYDQLQRDRDSVGTLDTAAFALAVVAVVGVGAGATLFLTGDDPDSYRFQSETGVEVSVVPLPGKGALVTLGGAF